MRYRNTITGAVIDTSSKISGGDWVKIQSPRLVDGGDKSAKGSVKKDDELRDS